MGYLHNLVSLQTHHYVFSYTECTDEKRNMNLVCKLNIIFYIIEHPAFAGSPPSAPGNTGTPSGPIWTPIIIISIYIYINFVKDNKWENKRERKEAKTNLGQALEWYLGGVDHTLPSKYFFSKII